MAWPSSLAAGYALDRVPRPPLLRFVFWIGLGFNSFFPHCVSSVSFRVLLFTVDVEPQNSE